MGGSAFLGGPFGAEPLEVVGLVVDVTHGGGDPPVPGLFGDEAVHLLGDAPVCRVALR